MISREDIVRPSSLPRSIENVHPVITIGREFRATITIDRDSREDRRRKLPVYPNNPSIRYDLTPIKIEGDELFSFPRTGKGKNDGLFDKVWDSSLVFLLSGNTARPFVALRTSRGVGAMGRTGYTCIRHVFCSLNVLIWVRKHYFPSCVHHRFTTQPLLRKQNFHQE